MFVNGKMNLSPASVTEDNVNTTDISLCTLQAWGGWYQYPVYGLWVIVDTKALVPSLFLSYAFQNVICKMVAIL